MKKQVLSFFSLVFAFLLSAGNVLADSQYGQSTSNNTPTPTPPFVAGVAGAGDNLPLISAIILGLSFAFFLLFIRQQKFLQD
jgi:hypothetical protein